MTLNHELISLICVDFVSHTFKKWFSRQPMREMSGFRHKLFGTLLSDPSTFRWKVIELYRCWHTLWREQRWEIVAGNDADGFPCWPWLSSSHCNRRWRPSFPTAPYTLTRVFIVMVIFIVVVTGRFSLQTLVSPLWWVPKRGWAGVTCRCEKGPARGWTPSSGECAKCQHLRRTHWTLPRHSVYTKKRCHSPGAGLRYVQTVPT